MRLPEACSSADEALMPEGPAVKFISMRASASSLSGAGDRFFRGKRLRREGLSAVKPDGVEASSVRPSSDSTAAGVLGSVVVREVIVLDEKRRLTNPGRARPRRDEVRAAGGAARSDCEASAEDAGTASSSSSISIRGGGTAIVSGEGDLASGSPIRGLSAFEIQSGSGPAAGFKLSSKYPVAPTSIPIPPVRAASDSEAVSSSSDSVPEEWEPVLDAASESSGSETASPRRVSELIKAVPTPAVWKRGARESVAAIARVRWRYSQAGRGIRDLRGWSDEAVRHHSARDAMRPQFEFAALARGSADRAKSDRARSRPARAGLRTLSIWTGSSARCARRAVRAG